MVKCTGSICGRRNSPIFLTLGSIRGESFSKHGQCNIEDTFSMAIEHLSDINKNCVTLKVNELCGNKDCSSQKLIIFTPKQFSIEDSAV